MATKLNLILVEDNELLRQEMMDFLQGHGWQVHGADCGETLNEWLKRHTPHIAILDVNLPYEDGYSIAARLRHSHPDMGIVMLTARVRHVDRTVGYRAGADVYLTKPTNVDELIAVVENLSRRVCRSLPTSYALHRASRELISPEGIKCLLTTSEYRLIELLALSPARRASKDYLCDQLTELLQKPVSLESLMVIISRLRMKCREVFGIEKVIHADRGVGYQLVIPITLK